MAENGSSNEAEMVDSVSTTMRHSKPEIDEDFLNPDPVEKSKWGVSWWVA
jgi:hypothetical protein